MNRFIAALVGCCALVVGCDFESKPFTIPGSPTAPSAPAPAPAPRSTPTPAPTPPGGSFPPVEFTEISVGQTVTGVVAAQVPECPDLPGWPCVFFRLTIPTDGTLTVELRYKPETQPPGRFSTYQPVDVSVLDEYGISRDADFFTPTITRVRLRVTAGGVYRIILWYAFPGLEYELQTSLE